MACSKSIKIFFTAALSLVVLAFPVKGEEPFRSTELFITAARVDPVMAVRVNSRTALYEVKKGDTLWRIASEYNTDWKLILGLNDMNGTLLIPGQFLLVPVMEDDDDYEAVFSGGEDFRRSSTAARGGLQFNLAWPLLGHITSPFGPRGDGFHYGLDIGAPVGTPIKAVRSGEVIFSGWKNHLYGNTVIIDHGQGLKTLYAHNNQNVVSRGDNVAGGEIIARVGQTGNSTGPHVHLTVFLNDEPVDPEKYLREKPPF